MSKYDPLYHYLSNLNSSTEETTLRFEQLEEILGSSLPESAYKYSAWWANPSIEGEHPHSQAWLAAGWKVDAINQEAKWVQFRRISD